MAAVSREPTVCRSLGQALLGLQPSQTTRGLCSDPHGAEGGTGDPQASRTLLSSVQIPNVGFFHPPSSWLHLRHKNPAQSNWKRKYNTLKLSRGRSPRPHVYICFKLSTVLAAGLYFSRRRPFVKARASYLFIPSDLARKPLGKVHLNR